MPVSIARRLQHRAHAVHDCVGRAGGAGGSARFDDGGATLLHGGDKISFQPGFILDRLRDRLALDLRVVKVGILGGGVIAPDGDVAYRGDIHARFARELRLGALFIAMRQLVLHGLPTTRIRTSRAAFFWMAWPWPTKIFPLMPSNSLRSMPALRGTL